MLWELWPVPTAGDCHSAHPGLTQSRDISPEGSLGICGRPFGQLRSLPEAECELLEVSNIKLLSEKQSFVVPRTSRGQTSLRVDGETDRFAAHVSGCRNPENRPPSLTESDVGVPRL